MIGRIVILLLLLSSSFYAQEKSDSLKQFTKKGTAFSTTSVQRSPTIELSGDNLGDVLQRQTASFIKSYGMGGIATLSLRGGSANQTKVYWNGIVTNSPTLGQTDLSLLPIEFMESVSINPGSSAAFDGVGGVAGSLSMESTNAFYRQRKLLFTKELGSFNSDKTHVRMELGAHNWFSKTNILRKTALNNFSYLDYGLAGSPQVNRTNAHTSLVGFQQRFGYKLKSNIFNLTTSYISSDREIPVAIGVSAQDQFQLDNSLKTALEWRKKTKKKMSHLVRIGFIKDDLKFVNNTSGIASEFKTQIRSIQYHNSVDFKKGWSLKSQLIGNQYYADSDGFTSIKIQNRASGFLNLSKDVADWNLDLSLRELWVDGSFTPVVPTAGIRYSGFTDESLALFLNVGRNYNHPSLNDLYWANGGNPNLLPEAATQFELGTRINLKRRLKINGTGFLSQVDNWIQWTPQSNGIWQPKNVKDVLKRGAELHLEYTPKSKHQLAPLMIIGNYQYLIAETISTYTEGDQSIGNDLIYTPRHSASLNVNYRFKTMYFSYTQSVTSKLYLDRTNTTYLPYSAPANIEISKSMLGENSAVKFKLGIYNIFNEEFQTVANQPLPGRYFKLGFTLNFYE